MVVEDNSSRKENKMQYKIGAKVKVTAKDAAYFSKVGEVTAVSALAEPTLYKVKFSSDDVTSLDKEGVWYCASSLALETTCEVRCLQSNEVLSFDVDVQFKIGDPVIVRESVPHYGGCKGKVLDVYGSIKTYVVEVMKNGCCYCSRTFLADELALDTDELRRIDAKMIKHFGHVRWEVGDKVIVVSNSYGPKVYGMKGKIEKIDNFGSCYVMLECGEGRREGLWFDKKELSRDISGGVEPGLRKKGSDVWNVNLAELAGRTVSGCKGLAFGEE